MRNSWSLPPFDLAVDGRVIRIVRMKREWDTDIENPQQLISQIRREHVSADLATLIQRLPESKPKFEYYWEWDNVAALPIKSHDHWFNKQLHRNVRNKLRKSLKEGVQVKLAQFDEDFIRGVMRIHDEVPLRQGRPFWHYRKSFEQVKQGYGTHFDRSIFIGAYYKETLIAFLKLVKTTRYVRTMQLMALIEYRDLAPMNAVISKAVEICADIGCPYLVYGRYQYGKLGSDSLTDFKYYNGFEKLLIPRYYIPLSPIGRISLAIGLHRGLEAWLPRGWFQWGRQLRTLYYERKYRQEMSAIGRLRDKSKENLVHEDRRSTSVAN